jgi:hypothetical protein
MAYTALSTSIITENNVLRSGTFARRPKRAGSGALYYATDLGLLLVRDSQTRTWYRADGRTLYVASAKYLSDRFTGPALASDYSANSGTDTDPADTPAIDTDDASGSILGNTGNAGTGAAADASAISGPVDWEMEEATAATVVVAEVMLEAATTVELFVGLSDTLTSTLEMPFSFSSGTAITSTADNACGFLYDTTADSDVIRLVGTSATTDATAVTTAVLPTAATYHTYVMVVTPTGVATFFMDGTYLGRVDDAIAVGTDANPIVVVNATTTTARYWRMRKFACHQDW